MTKYWVDTTDGRRPMTREDVFGTVKSMRECFGVPLSHPSVRLSLPMTEFLLDQLVGAEKRISLALGMVEDQLGHLTTGDAGYDYFDELSDVLEGEP